MILEQVYLGCLSQASYFVADEASGEAAVVDPRRDIDEYVEMAERLGVTIRHAVLTHFHADFASGHLELADKYGATIYLGEGAQAEYPFTSLADGDAIELGRVWLQAISTPGHTPESMSYLVFDRTVSETDPHAVLTGDTMFIGDVGRPDLLGSFGITAEDMAGRLFDSLRDKLMKLPPATIVYPGHGAGSMCGKNLSTDTSSTIGDELANNCALAAMSKDAFIAMITANQPQAPAYFGFDVRFNKSRHATLEHSAKSAARPLTPDEFLGARAEGAQVLDTRDAHAYAFHHVRCSINIGLGGKFATWAGTVLDVDSPILLICDPEMEEEAVLRLGRIGFDHVAGYLDGGIGALSPSWATEDVIASAARITAAQLSDHLSCHPEGVLLDVRTPGEYEKGSIDGNVFIPLNQLRDRLAEVPVDRHLTVYCGGGYRSAIAMGILEAHGNEDFVDLIGGFAAWERQFATS
jgi:hydroxyacylglutathione hydrolase